MRIDIYKMTKSELEKIQPFRNADKFDYLVILPTRRLHDSGYRQLQILFCNKNNEIVAKSDTGTDAINYFGYKHLSIDVLANGCFRVFSTRRNITIPTFIGSSLIFDNLFESEDNNA